MRIKPFVLFESLIKSAKIMSEDDIAKAIDTQSKNQKEFTDIFEKIEDVMNLPFRNEDEKAGAIKALKVLRNYILNREK
jgi:exoribonuclease R